MFLIVDVKQDKKKLQKRAIAGAIDEVRVT